MTGEKRLLLCAAGIGAVFYLLLPIWTHRSQPWDSDWYFLSLLATSALFGLIEPHRAWRWGATIVFVQAVVFFIQDIAPGPDMPSSPLLGLFVFLIYTGFYAMISHCAGLAATYIGRRTGHRNSKELSNGR